MATRRRLALLVAAVAVYSLAAWAVAPGFYDGFGPASPYNWTCPPPQAGANQKPGSGSVVINVVNGVSDANSAFTGDGQVVIGFLPGAFDATGRTSITVNITPLSTCPRPAGIQFVTNVYQISATAPLVKQANLVLRYSNLMPAPTDVYQASDPNGTWHSIGAKQQAQPFTIDTSTQTFGYFAAGYAAATPKPGTPTVGGGNQTLPIIVAVLIVIVLLAGLPLAVLRRRRGRGGEEEEEEDDDGEDEPRRRR